MSKIYDDWERLVAAVLKREQFYELCRAPSIRTPSIGSSFSFSSSLSDYNSISSSRFERITSINKLVRESGGDLVEEWVENYADGVYVVLGDFRDGTRGIILVGFSRRRFKVHQAQAWWLDNGADVCGAYKARADLPRLRKSSKVKGSDDLIEVEWIEQYATGSVKRVDLRQEAEWSLVEYNGVPMLALVKDSILEIDFDEILRSANLDGPLTNSLRSVWADAEIIERYERGVYLSLEGSGGIRDVERVRFSRNMFTPDEALAWWIENREKVHGKYRKP